jgi:hypothetical protein
MTALNDRRRRRTIGMLAATLAVLLAVPVLGWVGARAVANSTGGRNALADNLPIQRFPATPTAAFVTTDESGAMTSATVFVLDPSGIGGSAISVPITADVGFAADVRQSLRSVHGEGGGEATTAALESLLALTINHHGEAGPADVEALLAPLAPITVDLPDPVPLPATTTGSDPDPDATDATGPTSATDSTSTDGATNDSSSDGRTHDTLVPAGASELDARTAAAILTTGSGDRPDTARRPAVEALWRGIAAAVGDGTGAAPSEAAPATFEEYVGRLFAGPLQTRGLSATPLTGDANPDDAEVEEVARPEAVLVFGSIAPGAVSAPSQGLIFRLEAPPGYEAEVQRTIAKLLFLGGNVLSVDLTTDAQPNTVFIVPDEINRGEAGTTNMIFGEFTFEEPKVRIDGVDLTVVLGTDYLETVDVVAS